MPPAIIFILACHGSRTAYEVFQFQSTPAMDLPSRRRWQACMQAVTRFSVFLFVDRIRPLLRINRAVQKGGQILETFS